MPVEVGVGYVSVVPETRGFGPELQRQITGPSADAGRQAGRESGQGILGGIGGVLKAGIAGVAVVGAAVFTKAFGDSLDQGKITGKLSAQLGASGKDAQRYGKAAGKLWANAVVEDVETGAAAIKGIMQQGLLPTGATDRQIAKLGTRIADVSSLLDEDLGKTARAVGTMIKTGLVDNAGQALDVLTKGTQAGVNVAEDLLDTYAEYPTQFRKLGLTAASSMGLLSQGLKGGARDADTVADSLKEFSIRAVDGSKTSATAYKAIGLNAEAMSAQIAKGGKGASSGLQQVLDGLRAIKDPVKREAAAVGLFGTKAEDMGKSLYDLDLNTAAKGLGRIGGAADRAGKSLRDNAGSRIEIFKRSVQQGITNAVGKYAIPTIERFASVLNDRVLPPIKTVGSVLGSTLVPAVKGTTSALSAGVTWVKDYGAWLLPLGIAIGGVALTMGASALATGAATATFSIYRGVILATAAVTRGYAVAQGVLNAVMNANPIGLIITGIAALAALLYVAYQRSSTFRSIVQGAWSGIQAGWSALWSVLQPGVSGLMTGLRAIGTAASWLWTTVLSPVFGWIGTAAKVLVTGLVVLAILPIIATFKLLGAVGTWLWNVALGPAFSAIGTAGKWLWANALQPAFAGVMFGIRAVGVVGLWLWRSVFSPVLGWIGGKAVALWTDTIKPTWTLFRIGIGLLGAEIKSLWTSYAQPVFGWIGARGTWLWDKALRPAFDLARKGVKAVSDSFGTAKDAIKTQWDKLEGIAKKPVAFVIDTVYNKGIRGVWNQVAGAFGAPSLPKFTGFARGGVLPGQSSWRHGDDQLVPMRRGEGVAVSEAMRDPYERARLLSVNKAAMRGKSLRPFQGGGFAKGGIFDWVGSTASKGLDLAKSGVSWLKDGVKASAEAGLNQVVRPLIAKISGDASLYRDMITGIPKKMIKDILGYSGKADGKLESSGIGGKGFKAGLSWARTQVGKAYQWAGNGNPSWDCSGLVSAIESVVRGERPHRRWATGSFSGASAPAGWVRGARSPYMIGITNSGVGHTAGTINGTNVESRGGDGVVVGSRARSYHDPLFTDTYGFKGYASGGSPRPGEVAWVGENGPELLQFRGGEVVYSNAESMRMAAGLGPLRGFAKGTKVSASTKARREVPGDLTSFRKSLAGTAAQIATAAKALAKDLRAAGGAGKSLGKSTDAASAKLQTLAKRRDTVASKIATAKAAAADQAKSASDYLGLANISAPTSAADLITGLQSRQGALKQFEAQIKTAQKKGVSQSLIAQLVAAGPDSQLAGLVSGANAVQVQQLNALAKSGSKLSTGYGQTMADAMYDAGTQAGKGFLTGLQAQEAALQKEMTKLGGSLVTAIEKKLKIHSPSRETDRVGRMVGAGLIGGAIATLPAIERASVRMATAVIPSPAAAAQMAAPAAGLQNGQRLALVLHDGSQLDAYVDTRVDVGISDVRKRSRAGVRER
ncbi:phage tail tape measure protein [Streptomyces sp. NPDC090231]|uniref:phage tail tape measure protein n=1 Tax=unclassified Streptomyces TaxID=2593676 RepID=UPI00382C5D8D